MVHRSLVMGSVLLLGLTLGLAAQIPAGTKYVASSTGGQAGHALVTMDQAGAISSIIPLSGTTRPTTVLMGKRNDELLVFDTNRLHQIHVATGAQNYTTFYGPSLTGGLLDEDAGLLWCTSQGLLLKANDYSCTKLYTVTYMPNHQFQTVGWNGSTSDYLVSAQDLTTKKWQLFTIDTNGAILQTLNDMPRITGLDWSPWSGDMYASFDSGNGGVLRITQAGQVSTLPLSLPSNASGLAGVEVRQQPYEELVVVEGGSDPQHVLVLDMKGGITTFHSSSGKFAPAALTRLCKRSLWASTPWYVGHLVELSVQFGPARAGDYYQVALSFDHGPGLPVPGRGTIHLAADALFNASLQVGPPTFSFFTGTLDKDGKAPIDPEVFVPNLTILIGARLYGAAVSFNAAGITEVSNCWGATLRWT